MQRGTRQERGYGEHWQRLRLLVLRERPLCESCREAGRLTPATEVDHVDGNVRNLVSANLRPLCKPCHSRKTVACDGGLGRS